MKDQKSHRSLSKVLQTKRSFIVRNECYYHLHYLQKCTYGNKCKFRHPERGPHPQKSVTERLVEHAQRHLQARGPSLSLPLPAVTSSNVTVPQHQPLCKTRSAIVQSSSSVPKSRSVENVTSDLAYSKVPPGQTVQGNFNI